MPELRPDLDGCRLHAVGRPEVWLVFHGQRHKICGPVVYENLFAEATGLLLNDGLDEIEEGAEIGEGSCLVRFEGADAVYLLTSGGDGVTIHEASGEDALSDFALDGRRVRDVPALLRRALREGEPLISAPERAARTAAG